MSTPASQPIRILLVDDQALFRREPGPRGEPVSENRFGRGNRRAMAAAGAQHAHRVSDAPFGKDAGEVVFESDDPENPAKFYLVSTPAHAAHPTVTIPAERAKRMEVGDLAFFYHTGDERQIVGVVKVVKAAYPDKSDPTGKFVMVDVETVEPFKTPVTLAQVKGDPRFADMQLVRIARLSVQKVEPEQWDAIRTMGGLS